MIGEDVGMRINWGLGLAEVVSKRKTKQCVLMEVMGGNARAREGTRTSSSQSVSFTRTSIPGRLQMQGRDRGGRYKGDISDGTDGGDGSASCEWVLQMSACHNG